MNRREAIALLTSIPVISSVSRAALKADDVLVVECDRLVSQDTAARIKAVLQQVWPGQKCVVLDGSLKLKVLSKSESEKLNADG